MYIILECCFLSEEDRSDGEGGDGAGEVSEQAANHGVARIFDIYRPEIDSEHIERGVRRALQDAAETADEAVCAIRGHRL